jgi:AcrR family transcriptional regulator
MMNEPAASVRKRPGPAPDPRLDRRVVRTRRRLGDALMRLMLERHFDDITVQDVLDTSGVGRATFYGHFRGKQDLLLSHFECVLEEMQRAVWDDAAESRRILPVAELLAHFDRAMHMLDAISASGQMDGLWALAQSHLNALAEARLAEVAPQMASPVQRALAARFCGGAFAEMARWWMRRPNRPSAAEMDRQFHEMVWSGPLRG